MIRIRNTLIDDVRPIIRLCKATYPDSWPWYGGQLKSDLDIFPEGQLVAVDTDQAEGSRDGAIIGMAASLIVRWEDYAIDDDWGEFTDHGHFGNHDPLNGNTLYGAEIMVHPDYQGKGVGSQLYQARDEIARKFNLDAIRAGARLAGYAKFRDENPGDGSAQSYIEQVISGKIFDPTVSFQMRRGFKVIAIVPHYFSDPDSLGWAAVIEKKLTENPNPLTLA